VNNARAGEMYLLYQCGTPNPQTTNTELDLAPGTKVFEVPLSSVAVTDSNAAAFLVSSSHWLPVGMSAWQNSRQGCCKHCCQVAPCPVGEDAKVSLLTAYASLRMPLTAVGTALWKHLRGWRCPRTSSAIRMAFALPSTPFTWWRFHTVWVGVTLC
jgi:hypothetical protein